MPVEVRRSRAHTVRPQHGPNRTPPAPPAPNARTLTGAALRPRVSPASMSTTDLERVSLSSSANSVASSARTLSANVRKLHNALNLLLSDPEREQFIHCLNVYHAKRNVYDLVQTLNVILNAPSKRQLLPMLRLVIPRSDQLLFEQYTSEGLYLKSDLVASNGSADPPQGAFPSGHFSPNKPPEFQVALRGSPDSFSTSSDGTAPLVPLLGRDFIHEPPGELRQVTMKRHKSNEGLGFSIRGGSEHGVGIYVSLVEPGSLAEKEGLRIGDQIMKVNDKVFDKVTHADAVKVSCCCCCCFVVFLLLAPAL